MLVTTKKFMFSKLYNEKKFSFQKTDNIRYHLVRQREKCYFLRQFEKINIILERFFWKGIAYRNFISVEASFPRLFSTSANTDILMIIYDKRL